jgi:hypothetical protein
MQEIEMNKGEAQVLKPSGESLQLGAAVNKHIAAKSIAEIDHMKQANTMRDLVELAATREGLAALIESQAKV